MSDRLKYRDCIFGWICFCVPFIFMNRNWFPWGNFFGANFSHELVAWPLLVGILYSVYLQWKGKSVFVYDKWIFAFVVGALLLELISFLHGAYVFPYWDLIDNAVLPEKSRVRAVILLFQEQGWFWDEELNSRLFLVYTSIKDSLLKIIVPYGGMYMIYCWYQNDYKCAISVMEKAVMVSTLLLFAYCAIELFALWREPLFQNLLLKMDMVLHCPEADKVGEVERWLRNWTLNAKQMRGYFTEPSHLGMYANVMASFLWYRILKDNDKLAVICNLILGVIVVMTSSRAAVGIYCSMLLLLIVILLYKRDKQLFIKGCVILISSVIAFSVGMFFIKNIILDSNNKVVDSNNKVVDSNKKVVDSNKKVVDSNKKVVDSNKHASYIKGDVVGYFESNIGSFADVKARSNSSRYTYAYVAFKTGMEHPILGVGERFRAAYAPKYIPEWGRDNSEVKKHIIYLKEKWPFEAYEFTFHALNEYLAIFVAKGVVGVALYMIPFIFIVWKIMWLLKKQVNETITCILVLELLLGVALDGLNCTWELFYSTWITIAIAILFLQKNKVV